MRVRIGRGVQNGVVTVHTEGEPRGTPEYMPLAVVDEEVRRAIENFPPGSVAEIEYGTMKVVLPPGEPQRRRVITGIAPVSP